MDHSDQSEVDDACAYARHAFLVLHRVEARAMFAYSLQGFVSSEVERGGSFDAVVELVSDLLELLRKADREARS